MAGMSESSAMSAVSPAPVSGATTTIAMPRAPRNREATGLPFSCVCDLVLKVLYLNGSMMGRELANHICLPFSLLESTLKFLADEGYAQSTGVLQNIELLAGEPLAAGLQYTISGTGRTRAREILDLNQYAGPAPVPIDDYNQWAHRQSELEVVVNRTLLQQAFT